MIVGFGADALSGGLEGINRGLQSQAEINNLQAQAGRTAAQTNLMAERTRARELKTEQELVPQNFNETFANASPSARKYLSGFFPNLNDKGEAPAKQFVDFAKDFRENVPGQIRVAELNIQDAEEKLPEITRWETDAALKAAEKIFKTEKKASGTGGIVNPIEDERRIKAIMEEIMPKFSGTSGEVRDTIEKTKLEKVRLEKQLPKYERTQAIVNSDRFNNDLGTIIQWIEDGEIDPDTGEAYNEMDLINGLIGEYGEVESVIWDRLERRGIVSESGSEF